MSTSTMTEPAASAATAPETAAALLQDLRRLHAAGRLEIRVDFRRLNHMDSPVGVEADSNIWAYGVIVVSLLAVWLHGWIAGAIAFMLGAAGYFTIGRRYVHRRMEKRIEMTALTDPGVWQKLWRFGGLTLVALDPGVAEPCVAPTGNWLGFVRELRAASKTLPS